MIPWLRTTKLGRYVTLLWNKRDARSTNAAIDADLKQLGFKPAQVSQMREGYKPSKRALPLFLVMIDRESKYI